MRLSRFSYTQGEFKATSAFDELGIDSVRAVEFSTVLREELGIDLSPT